jgi:hypothetical protein
MMPQASDARKARVYRAHTARIGFEHAIDVSP